MPPSLPIDADVPSAVLDVHRPLTEASSGTLAWRELGASSDQPRLKQAMARMMAESLAAAESENGGVSRFNSSP